MLPALLATIPLLLAQESEPVPPTPFDRVMELEITEFDEPAIDGHGGTVVAEYEVEFEGTLHIWTTSELDLFLQVDDAAEARTLASDDNSGGGTTPYLQFEVHVGDWLVVLVAGDPAATGSLVLHLVATPETEAGRLAEAAARRALDESALLLIDGRRFDARGVMAEALPDVMNPIGPDHPDLLRARAALAVSMSELGDLAGVHAIDESIVAGFERTMPEDHPELVAARFSLAVSMDGMGDLNGARALYESVLANYERTLPEDHADLMRVRVDLAHSMVELGDLVGARALLESIIARYQPTVREDDFALLVVKANLASAVELMGDLSGARALHELVVAGFERTLPEDDHYTLNARINLAACMELMGDLSGARALDESALAGYERTLPEDHPDLLGARLSLALSMDSMGDLAGARALRESVVAGYDRILPKDHPDRLRARGHLAVSMDGMGDLAGSRALYESVLAGFERTLPEDHPDLLAARANVAGSMSQVGDHAGARALYESICAGFERTLPEGHPFLAKIRGNLAVSMEAMGDLAGARALRERVLATRERILPEDHPELLSARGNLANSMMAMGELAEARALHESVLAGCARTLPQGHPDLMRARANVAVLMHSMGDLDGSRVLLSAQLEGMRTRVLASLALAPREARQTVASESHRHSQVLFLSESAGAVLERSTFELTETMRLVAAEAARSLARFEADPELAPMLNEAAEIRRALNDLVAGAARDEVGSEGLPAELTRLSLRRDALERDASRRLAERGVVTVSVDADALTAALAPGDVAIGYRRVMLKHVDPASGEIQAAADHLLAHVLDSDGALSRIDLGPASEVEQIAMAWRAALGAPLLRGLAPEEGEGDPELRAGRELRTKILDPVLAIAGAEVGRLFVCADDLLYLLPLDALPVDGGKEVGEGADDAGSERVGDRMRIVNEVSFARLLAPVGSVEGAPSLLAFGGIDYDAEGAVPDGLVASSAPIESTEDVDGGDSGEGESEASEPEDGPASRSAMPDRFQKLLQARYEAEATADLFEEAFELEPTLLTKRKTTKAALFESASGKRYLHLATHGWFAPESVRSTEDTRGGGESFARMGVQDRVSGLAPMTLCGLALAGANNGRDSLGRVPGILTAEELCSLELSQCELAVLSACETNVGIRRAGQGIQSLQSALYAAGARTSITSLWKVDDAATRRLMEVFYTNLWIDKMGKADALWLAKKALRDEGHPPAHWAGWVLTGDPD